MNFIMIRDITSKKVENREDFLKLRICDFGWPSLEKIVKREGFIKEEFFFISSMHSSLDVKSVEWVLENAPDFEEGLRGLDSHSKKSSKKVLKPLHKVFEFFLEDVDLGEWV